MHDTRYIAKIFFCKACNLLQGYPAQHYSNSYSFRGLLSQRVLHVTVTDVFSFVDLARIFNREASALTTARRSGNNGLIANNLMVVPARLIISSTNRCVLIEMQSVVRGIKEQKPVSSFSQWFFLRTLSSHIKRRIC